MRVVVLVALSLLWCASAHAATVTLLRPTSSAPEVTEALFRLQGELLAVGLEVELATPPAGVDSDAGEMNAWFERMATEDGIDAVIEVVGSPRPVGVDVWIYKKASGRFRASRVVLEPNTANAPETLAIRAIEVLRANFLVLDLPKPKPKPEPAPVSEPDPVRDTPPPPEVNPAGRLGLAAGAAATASLAGVGPALQPMVRLDWALRSGLTTHATVSGFGTRPTVETDAGGVRVAQRYGLLGLRYGYPAESWVGVFAALASGALHTTLDGWASAPNRGHRVSQWSFVLEGSLGAQFDLSERYYLTLAAHVQFATPYVAIHFVDTEVAATGNPNLLASLTVGAWL